MTRGDYLVRQVQCVYFKEGLFGLGNLVLNSANLMGYFVDFLWNFILWHKVIMSKFVCNRIVGWQTWNFYYHGTSPSKFISQDYSFFLFFCLDVWYMVSRIVIKLDLGGSLTRILPILIRFQSPISHFFVAWCSHVQIHKAWWEKKNLGIFLFFKNLTDLESNELVSLLI